MQTVTPSLSTSNPQTGEKPTGRVKFTAASAASIPPAMREAARWIVWRYETRDGKPTKVPLQAVAHMGGLPNADTTAKSTWSNFEAAVKCFNAAQDHAATTGGEPQANGIGFVLGDGWGGIDFDEATRETGEASEHLEGLVQHLHGVGAYAERSPSGVGVKAVLRVDAEAVAEGLLQITGKANKTGGKFSMKLPGLKEVEAYFTGRYFTITGNPWGGFNGGEFTDGTQAFLAIARAAHGLKFRNKAPAPTRHEAPIRLAVALNDEEVVTLACAAKNGHTFNALYENTDGGNASEGDLGLANLLAFYCGPNGAEQVERIMRASPRNRDKFTDHANYLATTIATAYAGRTEFYDPSRRRTTPGTSTSAKNAPTERSELNEFTLMQAFVAAHMDSIVFTTQGRWYVMDEASGILKHDLGERVVAWATDCLESTLAGCVDCERERARYSKAQVVAAILKLARARPGMNKPHELMDSDPWMIGTPGGVLNLRTREMRKGTMSDLISKSVVATPASVADGSTCPNWLSYLEAATGGDGEKLRFLQRWAGYTLTGDATEHAFVMLHGPGGTGKSTFLEALQFVLHEYAVTMAASVLSDSERSAHPTSVATLHGARLATASEFPEGEYLNEARLKRITGGDRITARHMRQDDFTFEMQAKIVAATNHKPRLKEVSDAMARRLMVVAFDQKPTRVDSNLKEKLRNEAPGILAWMLDGLREYLELKAKHGTGLQPPRCVTEPTAAYLLDEDAMGEWFQERFMFSPEAHKRQQNFMATETLLGEWREWAEANSVTMRVDAKKLAEWLHLKCGVGAPVRGVCNGRRVRGFYGIMLAPRPMVDGCSD
jgi:putative DNA primase/helicase